MVSKILLGVVVVVILAVAFLGIGHIFTNKDRDSEYFGNSSALSLNETGGQQYQQGTNQTNLDLNRSENENSQSCENPAFTEYFVDPSKVQKVGQVGVVHGSGLYIVERSYVSIKSEFNSEKIPIYAPVDMTLRAGSHYQDLLVPSSNSLPDYALWFDADCNLEINFAHLKEVVESIAEQLPEVRPDSRNIQLTPLKFKAGDLIGYFIYKEGGVAGFDFIVRDKKIVNQFINQERYSDGRAGNLINGVCPYDYYEPGKKEEYYNLLGGTGGTLFKVKDCGNSSQDVAGTISGMWFLDKEPQGWIYESYKDGDYGSTLSIVGDEERVTVGNLGQNRVSWAHNNNPTYKLPKEITTEHCYQFDSRGEAGWVYFKVVSDTELDVVFKQTGNCPSSFPSNAKRYYK